MGNCPTPHTPPSKLLSIKLDFHSIIIINIITIDFQRPMIGNDIMIFTIKFSVKKKKIQNPSSHRFYIDEALRKV